MKKRISDVFLGMIAAAVMLCGCQNGTDSRKTEDNTAALETEAAVTETVTEPEAETETETEAVTETAETETAATETTAEPEAQSAQEQKPEAAYTYSELSVTMYASSAVNVRNLPSTDGAKIGSLRASQEAAVTGQCVETSWYRIDYNGQVGYVSSKYLVKDKPAESQPVQQPSQQPAPEVSQYPGLVSINQLANKSSLKKKCTDQEFQAAYDAAAKIVLPLVGLSREEQLEGIASALRNMFDSGQVTYSTDAPHYNDPYGYLVAGVASCAGCTRTTGLCLNMLGISYEHVHENQWRHQWCRVNVGGTYWICDAYGLYVGPEPAPYEHPYLE